MFNKKKTLSIGDIIPEDWEEDGWDEEEDLF